MKCNRYCRSIVQIVVLSSFFIPAFSQQAVPSAVRPAASTKVVQKTLPKPVKKVPATKPVVSPKKPKPKLPSGIVVNERTKELNFGFSLPLTGGLSGLGQDLAFGAGLVFNKINRQEGGVHGYTIKLLMFDDRHQARKASKNVKRLLKKTSMFYGIVSSDSIKSIPPDIASEIFVFFPNSGASMFRTPQYDRYFFYRASTQAEVRALVEYTVHRLNKRRIAVFYENSVWGRDGLRAAETALKALGQNVVVSASYVRNTVNIGQAVKKVFRAQPDTIICIAQGRPTYAFIQRAINAGLQYCAFLGVTESSLVQDHLLKSRGVRLVTSSVVPNPWKSKLEIAKEFRKAVPVGSKDRISVLSFEAYVTASLFVETLKKVTPPFTKEKIVAAIENTKSIDIKGLKLGFDSKTRCFASDMVWLNEDQAFDWNLWKFGERL